MAIFPRLIYTFGSHIKTGTAWLSDTEQYPDSNVVDCHTCKTQGSTPFAIEVTPRVQFLVTKPGTVDDIVRVGPYAVSEKAQRAIRKAGLTGVRFVKPIGIKCKGEGPRYDKTVKIINDLGLKILWAKGSGGSITQTNRLRMVKDCKVCGWKEWTQPRSRIKVDARQWDGSDFFRVEEYDPILMTQRAADVLAAAGLSNFTADLTGEIIEVQASTRIKKK